MEQEVQKARIGTCWLDGCSGCHMSLLDMDEAIVDVLAKADIVFGPLVDAQEWPEDVDVAVIGDGAISLSSAQTRPWHAFSSLGGAVLGGTLVLSLAAWLFIRSRRN